MKKRGILILCLLALLFLVCGCSGESPYPTTDSTTDGMDTTLPPSFWDDQEDAVLEAHEDYCIRRKGLTLYHRENDEVVSTQKFALPEPEIGTYYLIDSYVEFGGKSYVAISKRGQDNITVLESKLCPIDLESTALAYAGMELPGAVHRSGTDGTTCYFTANYILYSTDGIGYTELYPLSKAGIAGDEVVSIRADKDQIYFETQTQTFTAPLQADMLPKRETVILGICTAQINEYFLGESVASFNRTSQEYAIEVKSYDTVSDLNLAVLSGDIDLLASIDALALNNYAQKGFLLPLEEIAPDLFEEGVLMENVVEALRYDGQCYYLTPSFSVTVALFENNRLRELPEIQSFEDLTVALDTLGDMFYHSFTNQQIMATLIAPLEYLLVDKKTNTANFESEAFLNALEYCDRFLQDPEQCLKGVLDGGFRFIPYWSLYSVERIPVLYSMNAEPKLSAVLIPQVPFDGPKNPVVAPEEALYAVLDKPEAAAAFLRYIMTDEAYQQFLVEDKWTALPVNATWCQKAVDIREADSPIEETQEQRQIFYDLLNRADTLGTSTKAIRDIIQEECQAYFAGDTTAEQCASYIQNRVTIYLGELG